MRRDAKMWVRQNSDCGSTSPDELFPESFCVSVHIPVLPKEVIEGMNPQPGDVVIDGTLGGGGHARELLNRIGSTGRLIGFDRDPQAVESTRARIPDENALFIASNYSDIPEYLVQLGIGSVQSILLDLGLSSDQLADRDRGFSFQSDGPLDLRFNPLAGEPASRIVNRLSEKHLADLIYEFGEERLSRRIARKIVRIRHDEKIETSSQLARIVRSCVPRTRNQSIDPATRTFQALRIAVNEELKWLKVAMNRLPKLLAPRGRISVISFHSLEDRIVKQAFVENRNLIVVTKKPIQASEAELADNPRSRSAKLRVAMRDEN
jgi:16S rRNA (cytosine1402-N4)-methyltransferase